LWQATAPVVRGPGPDQAQHFAQVFKIVSIYFK
jgi:hypothetical protein